MSTEPKLLALANALREAVEGKSQPRRIAAARRIIAALAPAAVTRSANKRGRKPHPAADWAHTQLMTLAISVDGLPDSQAATAKWLRDRFDNQDGPAPSPAWLSKKVSEFKKSILIPDQKQCEKWRASTHLQEAFKTENDFLNYCRIRDHADNKWLHDNELRKRFETPTEYFRSLTDGTMHS